MTADDYIWTMRSKRVNGVPIGDAIEDAFANVEWSVMTDGTGRLRRLRRWRAGRRFFPACALYQRIQL